MWIPILRIVAIVIVGLGIPLTIVWLVIAQPIPWGAFRGSQVVVSPARLEQHVRMLSETFLPRHAEHARNLDRCAAYIKGHFEAARGQVAEQPYDIAGKTYRNITARFGPDSGARIVVGAHYDAFGPYPGADDNASGVAGLIELAYLLGKAPLSLHVETVAFTLEETPYFDTSAMGSAVHAQSLKSQGIDVRAMLGLEMIGYFSDAPGSQRFPATILRLFYPSTGHFIAVVGTLDQRRIVHRVKGAMQGAVKLPVYSVNAPRFVQGIDYSDHRNYWAAGFPAVMITNTAFYRNDRYHTPQDTPDTLDYARMAQVVQGVYAAVLDIGKEP